MKNTNRVAGLLLITLASLLSLAIPLGLPAAPPSAPATATPEIRTEVLGVAVSRLERDFTGRAVNPFRSGDAGIGEPGIILLAKIMLPRSSPMRLLEDKCRLVSFKDDTGADFLAASPADGRSYVFPANRPLEIMSGKEPESFGLKIRSSRWPTGNSSRLSAEVVLVFASSTDQRSTEKADVPLDSADPVDVGPVKIKLQRNPAVTMSRSNAPPITEPSTYQASFLPASNTSIVSVVFFSASSDEPILAVRNVREDGLGSSYTGGGVQTSTGTGFGTTTSRSGTTTSRDSFSARPKYHFTAPENSQVSVKVRYYEARSLVEKRCVISTGLGS